MQQTLMQQGAELMLYGMGTVFVFLTLLVVLTTIMSSLIQRYVKPEPPAGPSGGATTTAPQADSQLVAVIAAAIKQHRAR
ncbi:OadG family protein [Dasania sp. GY-MA-18]|uniref:Probable oxaloacetate decarboxylase gamma chain n=1 Tax=Dasania phycosphaerae TaxID=2950436 RepID=A0A9J6RNE2_9GAMM|nr:MULTISPECIES: OadG family protein [Dasania]MCR8923231.1 OadG family protein [Dasania sp. GY-MA-18]MCZ0865663.1 OadG family protein [Dasania phycosphaerae]MCZ0869388.1 OadG family protein [Dasania phycosphaerae]